MAEAGILSTIRRRIIILPRQVITSPTRLGVTITTFTQYLLQAGNPQHLELAASLVVHLHHLRVYSDLMVKDRQATTSLLRITLNLGMVLRQDMAGRVIDGVGEMMDTEDHDEQKSDQLGDNMLILAIDRSRKVE